MNEVFSFSRLSKLLKLQFRLAAKPLILYASVSLFFYVLTLWLIGTQSGKRIWDGFWILTCITGTGGVLLTSSAVCANIRSKIAFQTFNLLPASNLEKILSRVLICNILPLTIWLVLSFLLHFNDDFAFNLGFGEPTVVIVHTVMFFILVWLSSLSTFWGVVFRRFGFVAFVVTTTLFIVLIVNWLIEANLMFLDPVFRFISNDATYKNLLLVTGLFFGLLTLINLTAAYSVDRRKEMKLKLLNW